METKGSARTFLCGYIKPDRIDEALSVKYASFDGDGEVGWKKHDMSMSPHWCSDLDFMPDVPKNAEYWYGTYYESFVDSIAGDATSHWAMERNCSCVLKNGFNCIVKRLHLFRFPFGKNIIAIELDEPDADLNELTFLHSKMRDVSSYNEDWGMAGIDGSADFFEAIKPLLDISPDGKYTDWVDTGAKLKAFQIVDTEDICNDLLYELGSMSKIGVVQDTADSNSPAQSYYDSIMSGNTVAVFRNWTMLALLDTVTVVGCNFRKSMFMWAASYFRMIYLHALFQKLCLFDINRKFRDPSVDPVMLVDEMKDIERDYSFPTISYNFLPQLIYEKIKHGLDVDMERKQIHGYVEQEGKRQEELRVKHSMESERKLQKSLTWLTFLTLGSVLYDLTSWFFDIGDRGGCYRTIALAVLLVLLAVTFLLFKSQILEWLWGEKKK